MALPIELRLLRFRFLIAAAKEASLALIVSSSKVSLYTTIYRLGMTLRASGFLSIGRRKALIPIFLSASPPRPPPILSAISPRVSATSIGAAAAKGAATSREARKVLRRAILIDLSFVLWFNCKKYVVEVRVVKWFQPFHSVGNSIV